MIQVRCGGCGGELRFAESTAGKRGKCPRCGAAVQIPGAAAGSAAVKEALAAMEAKMALASRVEVADRRRGAGAIDLITKPPRRSEAEGASSTGRKAARRRMVLAALALALAVGAVSVLCWRSLAPAAWEDQQKERLLQVKREADELAAAGKTEAAFQKYGNVVLTVANRAVHDAELKQAVTDAREARVRLNPEVQRAQRARTAAYVH
jgi:hypothetical protein